MTDNTITSTIKKDKRYWEVDAARGICLIGMIILHTFFVMAMFSIISINIWQDIICRNIVDGVNFLYIHLGTSLFVMICGLSLNLRRGNLEKQSKKAYNIAVIKRGFQVFIVGIIFALIGSFFIHFFIGDGRYMCFTILMMMGCSMIICLPFTRLNKWACIPAFVLIILGFFFSTIQGPVFLLPFGILPDGFFYPRDYFPIFPWVGIMLLGFALGSVLYPNGHRRFKVPQPNGFFRFLARVGKYPLQIYVFHIPVLAGIIALICCISSLFGCPISPLIP